MGLKLPENPNKNKNAQLMEFTEELWKSRKYRNGDEEASECFEGDCFDQWGASRSLTEPCCGEIQKRTFRAYIAKRKKSVFMSISLVQ